MNFSQVAKMDATLAFHHERFRSVFNATLGVNFETFPSSKSKSSACGLFYREKREKFNSENNLHPVGRVTSEGDSPVGLLF